MKHLAAQVVGERRCPIIDTWWQTEVRTSHVRQSECCVFQCLLLILALRSVWLCCWHQDTTQEMMTMGCCWNVQRCAWFMRPCSLALLTQCCGTSQHASPAPVVQSTKGSAAARQTGTVMMAPLPGAWPERPGSATLPFFGVVPILVDDKARGCPLTAPAGLRGLLRS